MLRNLSTYYRSQDLPSELLKMSPFHSRELFLLYEQSPGYTPLMITVWEGDILLGQMLAVFRSSWRPFPPFYVRRCEIYGVGDYLSFDDYLLLKKEQAGTLETKDASVDYPEDVVKLNKLSITPERKLWDWQSILHEELLARLTKEAYKRCFLIECRNIPEGLFGYGAFKKNNFFAINWLKIIYHFPSYNLDEMIYPSREKAIARAKAMGVKIVHITSSKELEQVSSLMKRQMSTRVLKHLPTKAFLYQFYQELVMKGLGEIYLVHHKKLLIGTALSVFWGEHAYLLFSTGSSAVNPLFYPHSMAVYAAIQDAWRRDFKTLDMLGAGRSFYYHKYTNILRSFGGEQRSSRRWFRYNWPWLNRILHFIYD